MPWTWLDKHIIRHSDGHRIELKGGTWREPMDIDPSFSSNMNNLETVRLIRTGLQFASSNPCRVKPAAAPVYKSPKNRPVLSLKKKNLAKEQEEQ